MHLILVSPSAPVCAALERHIASLPDVTVVRGVFEDLPHYDAMVSAGNSFGLMDGGVDAAIARYFGPDVVRRVQQRIRDDYRGEQPVGTAFVVPTGHTDHPYLIYAPTMRVPMPIAHTDHAYNAMRAALLAVDHHNRAASEPANAPPDTPPAAIHTLAGPALGAGTGQMPPDEVAYQIALAYRRHQQPPHITGWDAAQAHQDAIHFGGDPGFQAPYPTR